VELHRIASWNGAAWDSLGGGLGNSVQTLLVYGGKLIAAGPFSTAGVQSSRQVASWDGLSWRGSPFGRGFGPVGQPPRALAVYQGNLVAGGSFGDAGSRPLPGLARWSGVAWGRISNARAEGFNSAVLASVNFQGALICGGQFSAAGDDSIKRIARLTPSGWASFGSGGSSGVSSTVRAFQVHDGMLYVGGWFTRAGGLTANHVARWNGSSWETLGSGLPGGVLALQLHEGSVHAGCSDGVVARWDGAEWVPVGNSLGTSVLALEVFKGQLYAGGLFASRVARWNGSNWIASGQGLASRVQDLHVYNDELYAAGWFDGGVALWNGSSWAPAGEDIPENCYSLTEYVGALHVGGDGGVKRLVGSSWENLGTQLNLVRSLTTFGPSLVVGGFFTQAGGRDSRGFALWQEHFVRTTEEGADNPIASTLRAWPNPFARVCTIELNDAAADARAGSIPLEIFDVSGRRVKLVLGETAENGILRWQWNGDEDSGQKAAAGVYFVRFPDRHEAPLKLLHVR